MSEEIRRNLYQSTFGDSDDITVVPSGLRGFRLMSWSLDNELMGVNFARLGADVKQASCWWFENCQLAGFPFYGGGFGDPCEPCAAIELAYQEHKSRTRSYSHPHIRHAAQEQRPRRAFSQCHHSGRIFEYYATAQLCHTNSPRLDCTCGWYAAYNAQEILTNPPAGPAGKPIHVGHYLVAVEASGRTILGSKGFRSEKMRVVAAAPIIEDIEELSHPSDLKSFRNRNHHERDQRIEWLSKEMLISRFPADNVSELLAERGEL